MIDALKVMRKDYVIDRVIVVADAAMIDKANRDYMVEQGIGYIIGDTIKVLGKKIQAELMDTTQFKPLISTKDNTITYREVTYKGRRIISTHSTKRARKDEYERQKLIDKARHWLDQPSKYKATKNRGAGRFIQSDDEGNPISINEAKIAADEKYDGFKAISTTTTESVATILTKYRDLFEVEQSFRALKSQLEIRPMFHWSDKRILGHIAMCFIAFTFTNHLKLLTKLPYKTLIKTMDKMQLSEIEDTKTGKTVYIRSKVDELQLQIIDRLKLKIPKDANPQSVINQYFT